MIWQVLIPLVPSLAAVLLALAGWLRSRSTASQLQSHIDAHRVPNTPTVTPPDRP